MHGNCRLAHTLRHFELRLCTRASWPREHEGVHDSSHRSCDLLLKATRGVTIAVVSSRERKRRQPGLATDDPAFVGWHQLVRGIQGSYVHFDFVCRACENGRAAAGTEKTARRSCVFRHRSSPHPEGTPRKREKGPHDACGSRDSDKGRPGMGVPTPQFERCRTGNRP